jgi:hypothetical protein
MTNEELINVLNLHSVPYRVDKANHILADNMLAWAKPLEDETDVTGYTKREIYEWLGY